MKGGLWREVVTLPCEVLPIVKWYFPWQRYALENETRYLHLSQSHRINWRKKNIWCHFHALWLLIWIRWWSTQCHFRPLDFASDVLCGKCVFVTVLSVCKFRTANFCLKNKAFTHIIKVWTDNIIKLKIIFRRTNVFWFLFKETSLPYSNWAKLRWISKDV